MKKRVPQGKKNEKQTGKASCFQLVEKRIAHFKDSSIPGPRSPGNRAWRITSFARRWGTTTYLRP